MNVVFLIVETAALHKAHFDSALKDTNEQIKDLLLEMGSTGMQSTTKGSVNSSATSVRLIARGKATAALKRTELQIQRLEIELCSVLLIKEEELSLARCRTSEKARLEALPLDEEAAIALATAKAIEDELNEFGLGFYKEFLAPKLPLASPNQCVQEYLDVQKQSSSPARDVAIKRDKPRAKRTL